jgi:hypothetical protein
MKEILADFAKLSLINQDKIIYAVATFLLLYPFREANQSINPVHRQPLARKNESVRQPRHRGATE